jgi:serine/threonine protein kinase/peptidoglycan hydrolase-like protein with peptidoglycan-binding domain
MRGVLAAGSRLRSYELAAVLGRGAFGITYRARDTTLGRDVAIKEYLPTSLALREGDTMVMPLSTALAEEFVWGRDRFLEEARTLATLGRAPAVARIYDFLEANGTAYIVMELAVGETLEHRIAQDGPLAPSAIERVLGPLLDGLEQVHDVGFLHRDIKPANIILDASGNPTLIDFGAARAALAGRTTAMTTIFTPGYAAGEQFTSARQGPWTDIYGLSATFYHAITGRPPPSAFDRMLEDRYEPLTALAPAGYPPGVLVGIDAGLAVKASDRPQTIAGWRLIIGQSSISAAATTWAMARPGSPDAALATPPPASSAPRNVVKWLGVAAMVLLLVLAGGGYYVATRPPAVDPAAAAQAQKAREDLSAAEAAQRAAELARQAAEQDAARLRAEAEARQKADAEAAQRRQAEEQRRQIEEEVRRRIEAEQAAAREKVEAAAEAQRKADEAAATEAAARRKAQEDDKNSAEATENGLRLATIDRQQAQVALTAMGFSTNGADGVFGPRTRTMIAAWQKARNQPPTGFFTGAQLQALLKEASPAVAKFNEEQKKLEEEKAKEAKRKAEEAAKTPPAATAPATGSPPASAPAVNPYDGDYVGTFTQLSLFGRSQSIYARVANGRGAGSWQVPVCGTVTFTMTVAPNGYLELRVDDVGAFCTKTPTNLVGRLENGRVKLRSENWMNPYEVELIRRGG